MKISSLSTEELVSRLMIAVINFKENEDKLESFPVIRKGSFAILSQICIGEKNDAGQYTTCLTVTNSMLEQWGFPKDKLFEIAADNSKRLFPTTTQSITDYLEPSHSAESIEFPEGLELSNITVLTNEQHFNGAATLFYDSAILDEIARKNEVAKMILVPSSVNQVYCIPVTNGEEMKDARAVCDEFLQMFTDEERLAENALVYDSGTRTITETNGQTYSLDLNEVAVRKQEHGGR